LEKSEMKKSLIALAVLAGSGAAMAQSSVTIYGILDTYLASVKSDVNGNSTTQNKLDSGSVNGSRWGFKGTEDLGGGLKANFQLESGFNIDDGTQGQGRLFGRQSWVGLSGGFGAVKLGRMPTPFDDVNGASDAVFDSNLSAMARTFRTYNGSYNNAAGTGAMTSYSIRTNNTIKFESANYGGFAGAASYALAEDPRDSSTTVYSSVSALNLTYAAGPLAVQLGYQTEHSNQVNVDDLKFTRLGGSYDFGVAKALLAYGKAGNIGGVSGADATEWQIGADVPVSAALTLSANYASSKDNDTVPAASQAKRTGYGLGAKYTLSKRTFVYGGYSHGTSDFTASAQEDTKVNLFAVGVQHRF
jgi:predicted porin